MQEKKRKWEDNYMNLLHHKVSQTIGRERSLRNI